MLAYSDAQASFSIAEKINQLKLALFNTSLNDLSFTSIESIQLHLSRIKTLSVMVYDAIAALSPEKINFSTVIQPLIDLDIYIAVAKTLCEFPMHVHADKDIRNASAKACEELEKLDNKCNQREDVFNIFHHYELNIFPIENEQLHPEEASYVSERLNSYKRNGLYIGNAYTKERINQIKNQLTELCIQFEKNINEESTCMLMTKDELTGLPEDWFSLEREISPGLYKVTLKYPDVFPILNDVSNRHTREKVFTTFETRCENENLPILKKVIELRAELASLMGYDTHADSVTEGTMAGDAKTVKTFLDNMNYRFTPLLEDNLRKLTAFAREKEKDPGFILQHYDILYYKRLREEAYFNVNMEELKKYFPIERVINGTLAIYSNLLGLKFINNEERPSWHSDVVTFDVFDKTTNEYLGYFNLDLHPREGKYSHAAAFSNLCGCDISHLTKIPDDRSPNIAAIVCNFPKSGNIPFEDAVTFFHEFGHVMHFMCSKTKLASNHSDRIETDFIEAPSQMLENWCFEPEALQMISSHSETHEPLPQSIAEKMHDKSKMHAGYYYKRQLVYAYFDFYIHAMTLEEVKELNIKKFAQHLEHQILQLPLLSTSCFPASFGHLLGGYDAGYYGYLISETYAADMFATIFKNNPMSAENGLKYRRCILEPGASQDAGTLLHDFLGRAPTLDAFLYGLGLSESNHKRKHDKAAIESNSEEDMKPLIKKFRSVFFKPAETMTNNTPPIIYNKFVL